jgi:putative membrane protein insertion efficiency factor
VSARPGAGPAEVLPKAGALDRIRRLPSLLGIALVYAYRFTFGVFVPEGTCKYHPSCSQYAIDSLRKYGLVRGSLKAGWRLLRCNPWSKGGVDYA